MSQWRNERPLTARSVLASALLGTDPPELPVAQLVRLAGLFGVNDNRARVALSRMVAAGEAVTDGNGRYRLAGALLDRQARQQASRAGRTRAWRGDWVLVVLTGAAAGAAERSARRAALATARLGELRDGVWARPANVSVSVPDGVEAVVAIGSLDLARAGERALVGSGSLDLARAGERAGEAVGSLDLARAGGRALAARLWDLDGWADRATELLDRLEGLAPDGPEVLAPGFVLSAAVLRHLQADPLLPPELAPEGWPAAALRTAYDPWDRAYRVQLAAWHRTPA